MKVGEKQANSKTAVQRFLRICDTKLLFCRIAFEEMCKALFGITTTDQTVDNNLCLHICYHSNRYFDSIHNGLILCVLGKIHHTFMVSLLSAMVSESDLCFRVD